MTSRDIVQVWVPSQAHKNKPCLGAHGQHPPKVGQGVQQGAGGGGGPLGRGSGDDLDGRHAVVQLDGADDSGGAGVEHADQAGGETHGQQVVSTTAM